MTAVLKMGAEFSPQVVGALQCQRNSFLKEFTTVVVRCGEDVPPVDATKAAVASKKSKKNKKDDATLDDQAKQQSKKYAVEFEDTILFPEGGGQPSDQGYVVDATGKKHFVDYIRRDKLSAVHLVDEPLEIGSKVLLQLDWKRRMDHMQQHTGQHLLSAVLDQYDIHTVSWSMGEIINYIEIPRQLSEEEIGKFSEEINDKIMEAIPISVETPEKELVNQGKLPDDYDVDKGVLRVVHIGELDQNPCCGTHLSSTAQILSIALLHQTSGKGTNTRLHFLAGDRVRQHATISHRYLKQACQDLSCLPEDLSTKIGQLSLNYRKSQKKEQIWMDEVAHYQSLDILSQFQTKDIVSIHKADVGLDYLTALFKRISKEQPEGKVLVLLSGEGKDGGSIIINSSDADETMTMAKHLQTLIKGMKGGGKAKWQGKISTYAKLELESTLHYLESL